MANPMKRMNFPRTVHCNLLGIVLGVNEELRAIALGYDAWAVHDRQESHEQESGQGSSTMDVMLYSFKVSASHVPLLN